MRFILPILLFISNGYAVEVKNYQNIKINILDKIYNRQTPYTVKTNENIVLQDLTISVTKCIQNTQSNDFALIQVLEKNKEIYNQWMSIKEFAPKPFEHIRYSIHVTSCY